jgi:hypothetical protein
MNLEERERRAKRRYKGESKGMAVRRGESVERRGKGE